MEISYKLEANDWLALQKYHAKKGMPSWAMLLIMLSVFVGFQVVTLLAQVRRSGWESRSVQNMMSLPAFLSSFLPVLFFIAFWFFVLRTAPRRQAKEVIRNSAVLSNLQTLRIEPTGIFRRDQSGEQFLLWNSLHDVAQGENQIFLFTEKDAAHVIPKRAFASSHQAEQFFEMTDEYWKAARGVSETPPIPAPH